MAEEYIEIILCELTDAQFKLEIVALGPMSAYMDRGGLKLTSIRPRYKSGAGDAETVAALFQGQPVNVEVPIKLLISVDGNRFRIQNTNEIVKFVQEEWAALKDMVRRSLASPIELEIDAARKFGLFGVSKLGEAMPNARFWLAPELSLTIELQTIELPPAFPSQSLAAPKVEASGRLEVEGTSIPFLLTVNSGNSPPTTSIQFDLQDKLGIDAVVARPQDVQAELLKATADTQIRVVPELIKPLPAPAPALPAVPSTLVVLPLTLDPGTRRVLPVRTTTIMFGDQSYDRQLASQAATATVDVNGDGKLFLMSSDRRQYDPELSVYFAASKTTQPDGTSGETDISKYILSIYRLPPRLANGNQPAPERLVCASMKPNSESSYKLAATTVFELALKRLVRPDQVESDRPVAALVPGDRLELTARPHNSTKEARIVADIAAKPVISPPPSVYTVIETARDKSAARALHHAAAPLPQKVEFPDLLRDLALERVQRRALFVWQYAKAEAEGSTAALPLDLVKFDRSGGAQLLA